MNDPPQTQPPCSDRGWPEKCNPLLVFLGTPRTWSELATWARERGMSGCRLRNMLAWLELEGVAGTFADRRLLDLGARCIIWRRYERVRNTAGGWRRPKRDLDSRERASTTGA